jgi:hypothetical protein
VELVAVAFDRRDVRVAIDRRGDTGRAQAYSVIWSASETSPLGSIATRSGSRRLAMARKVWTIRAQRSAAALIFFARCSSGVPTASSSSISAWPTMAASGLLSSWLTPARQRAQCASFSDW